MEVLSISLKILLKFWSGFNIALILNVRAVMGEVIMSPGGCRIIISDSGAEKKRFRNIDLFFDALLQLTLIGSCAYQCSFRVLLLMLMHYLVNSIVCSIRIDRGLMILTCPVTADSLNEKVLLNLFNVNLLFTGPRIRNMRSL